MFEIADNIGTVAFAMSGFFVAVRARLDFLGVLISVFLTAFGGGVLRDIIVGKVPNTFTDIMPGIIVLTIMILMILFRFNKKQSIENKPFFILSDSIGLVSFSITGAMIAIENDLSLTGILALSFLTAVGGGITRDIIINEVPFVLKTGFYGTVALLVGLLMYLLDVFSVMNFYSIAVVFMIGVALRLIAYHKKWYIPLV